MGDEEIINPLLTDPETDTSNLRPSTPDFILYGTQSFLKPVDKAYMVLLDTGQIFAGFVDRERAVEVANAVGGLMIELPIAYDARGRQTT